MKSNLCNTHLSLQDMQFKYAKKKIKRRSKKDKKLSVAITGWVDCRVEVNEIKPPPPK